MSIFVGVTNHLRTCVEGEFWVQYGVAPYTVSLDNWVDNTHYTTFTDVGENVHTKWFPNAPGNSRIKVTATDSKGQKSEWNWRVYDGGNDFCNPKGPSYPWPDLTTDPPTPSPTPTPPDVQTDTVIVTVSAPSPTPDNPTSDPPVEAGAAPTTSNYTPPPQDTSSAPVNTPAADPQPSTSSVVPPPSANSPSSTSDIISTTSDAVTTTPSVLSTTSPVENASASSTVRGSHSASPSSDSFSSVTVVVTGGTATNSAGGGNGTNAEGTNSRPVTAKVNVGAIAGGVVGGVIALVLLAMLAWLLIRDRKRQRRLETRETGSIEAREGFIEPLPRTPSTRSTGKPGMQPSLHESFGYPAWGITAQQSEAGTIQPFESHPPQKSAAYMPPGNVNTPRSQIPQTPTEAGYLQYPQQEEDVGALYPMPIIPPAYNAQWSAARRPTVSDYYPSSETQSHNGETTSSSGFVTSRTSSVPFDSMSPRGSTHPSGH